VEDLPEMEALGKIVHEQDAVGIGNGYRKSYGPPVVDKANTPRRYRLYE
jgi:hypothetical protein